MRQAAEITTELIASGLTPAQTALLMELVLSMSTGLSTGQSGENRAIENRRAWDRSRKQRERAARKQAERSEMSTGLPPESTGNPVDIADVRLTEEEKKEGLSRGKERKKGSRLLVGTRVSDEQRAIAIECGCPPDRVDALWAEFVDYWSDIPGQRGCKLTWTGTWRNRVKQIYGKPNGQGISTYRADPAAGRATARETQQVAIMGGAALRYLQDGMSAGTERSVSGCSGPAEVVDLGKRAENAR